MVAEDTTPDLPAVLAAAKQHAEAGQLAEALDMFAWLAGQMRNDAEVHVAWADVLAQADRPDQAKQHYRMALLREPTHREAALRLGELELTTDRPDEASAVFAQALSQSPGDQTLLLGLGVAYQLAARPARALRPLAAVEAPELRGRALYQLAQSELELHRPTDAARHLEQARSAGVDDELQPLIELGLGRCELMCGAFTAAQRRFERLAARPELLPDGGPALRVVRFLCGAALLGRQQLEQALSSFRELRIEHPSFLEARLSEIAVLQRRGRYPDAWMLLAHVEDAMTSDDPDEPQPPTLVATSVVLALIELGRLDRAGEILEPLEGDDEDECVLIARATLALARRDAEPDSAFDHYETAVVATRRLSESITARAEDAGLDPDATATLAGLLLATDQTAAARTQIDAALRCTPDAPILHLLLGIVHARDGRHSGAAASYRTALRHDPSLLPAQVRHAHALLRQELIVEAANEYEAVLAKAPGHVEAHAGLAHALTAIGDRGRSAVEHEQAVEHFEEALRLARTADDDDLARREGSTQLTSAQVAAIEYGRGFALTRVYEAGSTLDRVRRTERLEQALAAFRQAERADPANRTAARACRAVERRLGRLRGLRRAQDNGVLLLAVTALVLLVFVFLQVGYFLDWKAVDAGSYRVMTPALLLIAIALVSLPELLSLRFGGFELQKTTVESGAPLEPLGLLRDDRLFDTRHLQAYDINPLGGGGAAPSGASFDPAGLRLQLVQRPPDDPPEAARQGGSTLRGSGED